MIAKLSERIWAREAFQADYAALLVAARQHEWDLPTAEETAGARLDRNARLLQTATHFAASVAAEHRQAAYRIAIAAWQVTGGAESPLVELAALILNRLGNLPALDFLHDRTGAVWEKLRLPMPLWLENQAQEKANTVQLEGAESLRLTGFQTELWHALASGSAVIVNAPTSAGKSFALQHYLVEMFHRRAARICVYLVPSRALITQVADNFCRLLGARALTDVVASTIPHTPEELAAERVLYVLTQERLQMLLDRLPNFRADFIVVDEAQMVADDARGIVLQTAVERLRANSPDSPLLFGSPTASNPEVFKRLFRLENPKILKAEDSPVSQDIILVELDASERTRGTISLRLQTGSHAVGTVDFESTLAKAEHILTHATRKFGRGQPSLVYVGSADRCEGVATMLIDSERLQAIYPIPTESQGNERLEFAQFLRAHFHEQYALAAAVEFGVAFHYSGMPSTIRQALESLFDSGALHTLVCTATLLHGVNLPARNLFVYDPTKNGMAWSSNASSLTPSEFWNLAGRAGRLKREFSGNIFLLAPDRWRQRPYEGSPRQEVVPALAAQLTKHRAALLAFILDREGPSGKKDKEAAENAFMRLVNDHRRDRIADTLAFLDDAQAAEVRAEILPAIVEACVGISVPPEVAEKNPNVSIYRQQELLDLFLREIPTAGAENFLPKHPQAAGAWAPLAEIFARVHRVFFNMENEMHRYLATVAVQWMEGQSYAEFIRYEWQKKREEAEAKRRAGQRRGVREPKLASAIRNVFNMIEHTLRFTYVKYTKCYMDLLAHALEQLGRGDLVDRLVPIPLYLELGASSVTMVNLIGLGLSRVSAAIISEHAPNANMTRLDLSAWLRDADLANRGVSPVALREIAPLLRATT